MSRIAMNMPRHIKVKPNQVAMRAWVVLQIGVALLGTDFGMSGDRKNRAENCKGDGQQWEAWGDRESKAWQDEIADRGGNVHHLIAPPDIQWRLNFSAPPRL
jgi:hypothetical protein